MCLLQKGKRVRDSSKASGWYHPWYVVRCNYLGHPESVMFTGENIAEARQWAFAGLPGAMRRCVRERRVGIARE